MPDEARRRARHFREAPEKEAERAGTARTSAPQGAAPRHAAAHGAQPEAAPEPRRPRGPRWRRVAVTVVVCVLVVLLVGVGVAFAWWRHSVEQGRQAMTEEVAEHAQAEEGTIEYDGRRWRLNEDIVTICFIGYDDSSDGEYRGGQADAIIVLALDTSTGEATAINVPRDSMVTVDAYSGSSYAGQTVEQICLQYSYGDGAHTSSELMLTCVSRLLYNVPISYYFTLNVNGVGSLNDAVGGVTLTALQDLPDVGISEGEEVTLLGKAAERYVQYRELVTTGSLDRQARQIQYLRAYASKVIEVAKSDPGKLLELYQVAQDYTYTNLGLEEFTFLADTMLARGLSELEVVQLEGEMTQGEAFAEYELDKDFLREQVIETFYEVVE